MAFCICNWRFQQTRLLQESHGNGGCKKSLSFLWHRTRVHTSGLGWVPVRMAQSGVPRTTGYVCFKSFCVILWFMITVTCYLGRWKEFFKSYFIVLEYSFIILKHLQSNQWQIKLNLLQIVVTLSSRNLLLFNNRAFSMCGE